MDQLSDLILYEILGYLSNKNIIQLIQTDHYLSNSIFNIIERDHSDNRKCSLMNCCICKTMHCCCKCALIKDNQMVCYDCARCVSCHEFILDFFNHLKLLDKKCSNCHKPVCQNCQKIIGRKPNPFDSSKHPNPIGCYCDILSWPKFINISVCVKCHDVLYPWMVCSVCHHKCRFKKEKYADANRKCIKCHHEYVKRRLTDKLNERQSVRELSISIPPA